jgi:hypothetical protein
MTRNARLIKAGLAAALWIVLHVPLDLLIIETRRADISAFAVTVQLLDVIIIGYLVFQILQYRRFRPWKCVVCDGFGRRYYGPAGGTAIAIGSPICNACQGSGVLWESLGQK